MATLDLRGHGESDATFSRYDAVAGLALVGPFVRNAPISPMLALAFRVASPQTMPSTAASMIAPPR